MVWEAYLALNGLYKMQNIPEIQELIKLISKLPGLGPKSARRIILKLINNRQEIMKPMLNSLGEVFKNISSCQNCASLKSQNENCKNCQTDNKKFNTICVVENVADQWSIENSSIYKGYFHILGGTISETSSNKISNLLIDALINRVKNENIEEVIIATSATVEGQTTAFYIQDNLKNTEVKISKLGQGLPIGGEIENLDDGTLISAFKNRKGINKK